MIPHHLVFGRNTWPVQVHRIINIGLENWEYCSANRTFQTKIKEETLNIFRSHQEYRKAELVCWCTSIAKHKNRNICRRYRHPIWPSRASNCNDEYTGSSVSTRRMITKNEDLRKRKKLSHVTFNLRNGSSYVVKLNNGCKSWDTTHQSLSFPNTNLTLSWYNLF